MEKGYLYIASGEKYIKEAKRSVQSLRRVDDNAHATIVTDDQSTYFGEGRCFDKRIIVSEDNLYIPKKGFDLKVKSMYQQSPYDKTIFIDSDTYFIKNCSYLFDLLKYHDVCISRANNDDEYIRYKGSEIKGYGQYNTGVIVFRKNERNKKLFSDWVSRWRMRRTVHSHDQMAFMEALLSNNVKTYILKNNWNARTVHKTRFIGQVKIIHGRHKNIDKVVHNINISDRPRVWIPEAEICMYNGMRYKDVLKLMRPFVKSYLDTSSLRFLKIFGDQNLIV